MGWRRKRPRKAKTVAVGCDRLPRPQNGKGRVDATSLLLRRGSPSTLRKRVESREPEGTQDFDRTYHLRETGRREDPRRRRNVRVFSNLRLLAAAQWDAREHVYIAFTSGASAGSPLCSPTVLVAISSPHGARGPRAGVRVGGRERRRESDASRLTGEQSLAAGNFFRGRISGRPSGSHLPSAADDSLRPHGDEFREASRP
jgi:hypothetical protein